MLHLGSSFLKWYAIELPNRGFESEIIGNMSVNHKFNNDKMDISQKHSIQCIHTVFFTFNIEIISTKIFDDIFFIINHFILNSKQKKNMQSNKYQNSINQNSKH